VTLRRISFRKEVRPKQLWVGMTDNHAININSNYRTQLMKTLYYTIGSIAMSALFGTASCVAAQAFLEGRSMRVYNLYQGTVFLPQSFVVNSIPGVVEVPNYNGVLQMDVFDADPIHARIIMRGTTTGGLFGPSPNVIVFTNSNPLTPMFTNVTFDASNWPGLSPRRLTYTASSISVDLGDLQYSPTNIVRIDIERFVPPDPTLLSIEVADIRLCWNSQSNKTYQVQYRSEITTNLWTNLGPPQVGNGTTNCITDAVVSPRRFYQMIELP
jgi:hypothetical protein